MLTFKHRVAGEETVIRFPETDDDVTEVFEWLRRTPGVLGLDTETTGLNTFTPSHRVRLVQIGNAREAWCLDADRWREYLIVILADARRRWVCHNSTYDLLVLDRHGLASLESLGPRVYDTYILAHLISPLGEHEGGFGLSLKPLCAAYVDPDAPDTQTGLYEVFRREYKATKATGWAKIDLTHPTYLTYAGLDVILVSRLFRELTAAVKQQGTGRLAEREHVLMVFLAKLERRGLLVDVDYTRALVDRLLEEADANARIAATFGVESVNSTRQLSAALLGMGEVLTDKTAGGAPAVGKEVLLPLADLSPKWERLGVRDPNPLADAVLRSKRAGKWRESYAQAFLDRRDAADRVHPNIKGLAARTARMSISNPPLQQLPSGDWTIRRAILADPGNVMISVDYQAIEMRVLAALAGVERMKQAITAGEDLHAYTARLVYGENFTPYHRKVCKGVGFGKVYGGGAATLSRQTGAPIDAVKEAIAAYDTVYPEIRTYARTLQRQAEFGRKEVVTPSGRHLPLDRDRLYAATNYVVQSYSRDVLAGALLRIDEAGLGDYVLLPIHDEVLAQAPASDAEEISREIARLMETTVRGVPITTDPEIGGRSWGSLPDYGAPE